MSKRLPFLTALFLGVLGVVTCFSVIVATWIFTSRLSRAAERACDGFENALSTTKHQLAVASDRVDTLKLNAEDVRTGMKSWSEREVASRPNPRDRIEESLGRLESGLDQVDHWLELTESSVQIGRQAMESAHALGMPLKPDALERLLEDLASLRATLSEAAAPLERISQQASQSGEQERETGRAGQIAGLTTRLIATFGSVDRRLASMDEFLDEAERTLHQTRTTILSWIRIGAIGVTLLGCWMAAGQASLIYLGVRGSKPLRSATDR